MFIAAALACMSTVASVEGQGAINIRWGCALLGSALQDRYAYSENLILCGVASFGLCGSMSETKRIENNFEGDICRIVIFGDYHIASGNCSLNAGLL